MILFFKNEVVITKHQLLHPVNQLLVVYYVFNMLCVFKQENLTSDFKTFQLPSGVSTGLLPSGTEVRFPKETQSVFFLNMIKYPQTVLKGIPSPT